MVLPRLGVLSRLDHGQADIERRFKGLVRRGRVAAISRLYAPAVIDVDIYGLGGQMARVRNLPLLTTSYDLSTIATPRIGADVLILVPTGVIEDGGYVLGLVAKPAVSADNLANEASDVLRLTARTDSEALVGMSIPSAGRDRTLHLVGIQIATAGGTNALPRATVQLRLGEAVLAQAVFRPQSAYSDGDSVEVETGTGDTLPALILDGEIEHRITAGQALNLQVRIHTASVSRLPLESLRAPTEWGIYRTTDRSQMRNTPVRFPRATDDNPLPLMRLYGGVA